MVVGYEPKIMIGGEVFFPSPTETLVALKESTEELCKKAKKQKIVGAINWADLHCVSAERYIDQDGNSGYRVLVQEASPEAVGLQQYIERELVARGFVDVKVMTEW